MADLRTESIAARIGKRVSELHDERDELNDQAQELDAEAAELENCAYELLGGVTAERLDEIEAMVTIDE